MSACSKWGVCKFNATGSAIVSVFQPSHQNAAGFERLRHHVEGASLIFNDIHAPAQDAIAKDKIESAGRIVTIKIQHASHDVSSAASPIFLSGIDIDGEAFRAFLFEYFIVPGGIWRAADPKDVVACS